MDFIHRSRFLDETEQAALLEDLRHVVAEAPLYTPTMRNGSPYNLQMTNCGSAGWVSDSRGYRYTRRHPITKKKWPRIPARILEAARKLAGDAFAPDCCLVNLYRGPAAKLGLHRDTDEGDFTKPIVSFSLGDSCEFIMGGTEKTDPQEHVLLQSGDAVLFGGSKRLTWHGVKKVFRDSSTLLEGGGRLNLTLRMIGDIRIHED